MIIADVSQMDRRSIADGMDLALGNHPSDRAEDQNLTKKRND